MSHLLHVLWNRKETGKGEKYKLILHPSIYLSRIVKERKMWKHDETEWLPKIVGRILLFIKDFMTL